MGNVNQNEEAKIFAENLSYYMKLHKVDRVMLANELGFKYTTVCDWCNGKVVPRKNKIKVLANYFSISESDLTWRDNLLTDKNINKKREILVYKDFPTKLSFDKDSIAIFSNNIDLTNLIKNLKAIIYGKKLSYQLFMVILIITLDTLYLMK